MRRDGLRVEVDVVDAVWDDLRGGGAEVDVIDATTGGGGGRPARMRRPTPSQGMPRSSAGSPARPGGSSEAPPHPPPS